MKSFEQDMAWDHYPERIYTMKWMRTIEEARFGSTLTFLWLEALGNIIGRMNMQERFIISLEEI